jgi:hypothetical protein
LLNIWNHIQRQLFPILTEELGDLTDTDRHFVTVMALVPLGPFLEPYRWQGRGASARRAGLDGPRLPG